MIDPLYSLGAAALFSVLLLRLFVRYIRTRSIAYLPGPPPSSWLVGDLPALVRPKETADADFAWTREYGNALRFKGTFGKDILFTSDPKAMQYILNTSGYNYYKPNDLRALFQMTMGKGIIWAEGEQHSRHRKVMNPAFSYSSLRVFLPLFTHTSQRTVNKLKEYVHKSGSSSVVTNIFPWLARTTLDAIGEAALNCHFGAIDEGDNNKLAKAYKNLFTEAFLERSDAIIVFETFLGLLPSWVIPIAFKLPSQKIKRVDDYMKVAREVAKAVVDRQVDLAAAGKEGSKDVMSILVRANLSENPKTKLDEEEVLSQLTTLFLAGHETTASTITWALYELSKHPEYQKKIREEIKATRARAAERGDTELSVADHDSMKYTLSLMKEALRFHPIAPNIFRQAIRDDVIPLSVPQKTKRGETINRVPISRGQRVFISVAAYNRLKSVWGEDADQWRPERFLENLEGSQKTNLGVIANIASFGSGVRGCIGWRFAVIEMQAILIELLESFEFSPPGNDIEILRGAAGMMSPMVKGANARRTELPLTVTVIEGSPADFGR